MPVREALDEVQAFSRHDGAPFPFPHRDKFPFLAGLARNLPRWRMHGPVWGRSPESVCREVVHVLGPEARRHELLGDLVTRVRALYAGTVRAGMLFTSPPPLKKQ